MKSEPPGAGYRSVPYECTDKIDYVGRELPFVVSRR